jgi:DNA-binding MarR family transcriptional regulator
VANAGRYAPGVSTARPRAGSPPPIPATATDAERAWASMIALMRSDEHQARFTTVARAVGLTMASMRALLTLDPEREIPMRALAGELQCDASNVTQLVDALEQQGYVERTSMPTDRRVKLLKVTKKGAKARTRVIAELHEPPAPLLTLSAREQAELARLLDKALASADPPLPLFHL